MENSPSKMKNALNFGAILGLVLMILSIVTYIFEMYEASWIQWLSYGVLIAGIVIGIKNYRDQQLNGFISYGNALGYGVLISLFASIITGFVNYIYLGFIDPGFLEFSLEAAEMAMYDQGVPEDQMEMALGIQEKILSPPGIAIVGIVATTFMGFIFSLIVAAVLKNDPVNFEDVA